MEPQFTRTVRAGQIKETPQSHALEATPQECQTLAALYGLPGIAFLRGTFTLQHARGGVIAAQLRLRARVTQICVVSLEPFEATIDEAAELAFVPAQAVPETAEFELDPETLEGPDEIPYSGDLIDLGATLAEQLALALDPYPRKPGAELPEAATAQPDNPFAVLKRRGSGES
ncbi:MAG: hypothetical protein B7Z81_12555 [Acidocella sp. 20-61-6]|nr:MAG: hypothetical protein B7Z81_12555 [Acidocella sp. 20-61-6]